MKATQFADKILWVNMRIKPIFKRRTVLGRLVFRKSEMLVRFYITAKIFQSDSCFYRKWVYKITLSFFLNHLSFVTSFALHICKYNCKGWLPSDNWHKIFSKTQFGGKNTWARQTIWNIGNNFSFLKLYETFMLFPCWQKLYEKNVLIIRFHHNWFSLLYSKWHIYVYDQKLSFK